MTPHQIKLKNLIDLLASSTANGTMQWRLGGEGKSALTSLNAGIIELKHDFDDEGQDAVRVIIYDRAGNVRSSFDDTALAHRNDFTQQVETYYTEMKDLLDSVIRAARGEDAILNSIIDELNTPPDNDDVPF